MKHWATATGLVMTIGMLAGCGSGSDFPLVPVNGLVTFSGGPPPKEGRVIFSQLPGTGIEGLPNRPGRASFGADGKFVAMTFEQGDGLLPGKYDVRVECVDGVPSATTPWDTISFVPSSYQPPELIVAQGKGPIEVSYDVPPNPNKRK
jgi:hypothetical protein